MTLTTLSIEPAMIDPADLKPPANLHTAKHNDLVMEDDLKRPQVQGVIEDLMGGKN
jgi:hypothetical protein